VLFALGIALIIGALNSLPATAPAAHVTIAHAVVVGIVVVLAFALLERYPARPPSLAGAVGLADHRGRCCQSWPACCFAHSVSRRST
jgi:hypothetical protein